MGYTKEHTLKKKKTGTLQEDLATDLNFITLHLPQYKTRIFSNSSSEKWMLP